MHRDLSFRMGARVCGLKFRLGAQGYREIWTALGNAHRYLPHHKPARRAEVPKRAPRVLSADISAPEPLAVGVTKRVQFEDPCQQLLVLSLIELAPAMWAQVLGFPGLGFRSLGQGVSLEGLGLGLWVQGLGFRV